MFPMNWNLPTIAGIQRIAVTLTVVIAALMGALVSERAAISSAIGGGLMIANLYLLVIVGKTIIGMASNGGGAVTIGALIAPFKLLFFMLVVYLILTRVRVDIFGFMLGVLTQFAAIFIETGRVSMRGSAAPAEEVKA